MEPLSLSLLLSMEHRHRAPPHLLQMCRKPNIENPLKTKLMVSGASPCHDRHQAPPMGPPMPPPTPEQLLPTSISIRSTQYCYYAEMIALGRAKRTDTFRVSDPVFNGPHRVYKGRGENSERGPAVEACMEGAGKTELCRNFQRGGRCTLRSEDCLFAHGIRELRPVLRHPKYRTKPCGHFLASHGRCCPYGDRCQFIHPPS